MKLPQMKNLKQEVPNLLQDGGGRNLHVSVNGFISVKYWPILLKFEVPTQDCISK